MPKTDAPPMTDNDDLRERGEKIDAIAADLLAMRNSEAGVRQAALAAKNLVPGQAVQHTLYPNIKGVVGNSVTDSLQVAVTQPDNLDGAICFADPRNLRLAALSATPIEALQQRVERLEVALREAAERECSSWCYPSGGEHTRACIGFRAALGDDVG